MIVGGRVTTEVDAETVTVIGGGVTVWVVGDWEMVVAPVMEVLVLVLALVLVAAVGD